MIVYDLYIREGDREYHMGCLPRRAEVGAVFPSLESNPQTPLIPRNQWEPIDFRHFVPKILDQNGTNACNAFAAIQALHVIRSQAGLPFVELSPGNLYGQINGGADRGSLLGDAVRALADTGVCKAETVSPLQWRRSRWPATWREEAKRFRILEAYDCPSFERIASAILYGFPVDFGVFIGGRFRPHPETGWLPEYLGGGGGHAMCGVGLAYHEGHKTWGIIAANSWGEKWGLNGFCIVPESYFRRNAFADAWAVRGVVDPIGPE